MSQQDQAPPRKRAAKKAAKKRAPAKKAAKTVKAPETVNGAVHAVEDGIDAAHAFFKRQFAERPGVVVGTTLAVGLVIGVLLSNGRR
ncbi:MAG: hypothetical protein AB7J28_08225 [Hyphomonadaceae bacterium]